MNTTLWPALPLSEWKDTYETLHRWMQIVGKIRLMLSPPMNHWWNTTMYVTPRGLTTSSMTYKGQYLQIDFDFTDHSLLIRTTKDSKTIDLQPGSVANFYYEVMRNLQLLGMPITIWTTPVEVQDRTPFEKDEKHAAYDPEYAQRVWRIMAEASRVFTEFRSRFIGKVSPVHFFWGAFDLAVTRFSGRRAPPHPGAPNMARFVAVEAYSHEVSSCGFWPGGGPINEPSFYAYAYPEPQGFKDYPVQPQEAFYHKEMGKFLLPYDVVSNAKASDDVLLSFLQTSYEAAATCARWDRESLEHQ
jgi:hypothetical protein